jgi:ribosomal protein L13
MRTFSAKANEVQRQWWVIDAADQVLGRVAVKAATLLRGKEKAIYTPHVDTGDFVIVINADKVRVTGKKETDKTYMSFSGFRRRPQDGDLQGSPRAPSRVAHRKSGEGDDPSQPPWTLGLHQAKSL